MRINKTLNHKENGVGNVKFFIENEIVAIAPFWFANALIINLHPLMRASGEKYTRSQDSKE